MTQQEYIDHAVRIKLLEEKDRAFVYDIKIQLLEKTTNDIKKVGYWILGTIIVGIALPVSLHSFGLI
jgi:hypothetical protein